MEKRENRRMDLPVFSNFTHFAEQSRLVVRLTVSRLSVGRPGMNWRMVYALLFFLLILCGIVSTRMAKRAHSDSENVSQSADVYSDHKPVSAESVSSP
jgi:hypothetical protein